MMNVRNMGAYDPNTEYRVGDVVTFEGGAFRCVQPVKGVSPNTNVRFDVWKRLNQDTAQAVLLMGGGSVDEVARDRINQLTEEMADLIYVGGDEPTAQSTQVWIDTDDEGDSNVVTSVNGMTGDVELHIPSLDGVATEKYVDDAVSKAAEREGTYELIETITLTEDTEKVERGRTPDGVAYGFDNVVVMIELPAGTYEANAYYAQIYFGATFISLYHETTPSATAKKRASFQFETRNGKINAYSIGFSTVAASGNTLYTQGGEMKGNADFHFAQPIHSLRVKSNKMLPAGTEIKIYGVVK